LLITHSEFTGSVKQRLKSIDPAVCAVSDCVSAEASVLSLGIPADVSAAADDSELAGPDPHPMKINNNGSSKSWIIDVYFMVVFFNKNG
jgi:hypothetical protein